jgi:hypothetical protein
MGSNENQLSGHNHRPSKVKKQKKTAKNIGKNYPLGKHRAALYGIAASPGADIRSGIVADRPVSALRPRLARSVYLAAIAIAMAMVGWMWMLFVGLE